LSAVTIDELTVADDPAGWAALGFDVAGDCCQIGSVRLRFVEPATRADAPAAEADAPRPPALDSSAPASPAPGLAGWSLRDAQSAELDGLPTTRSERPLPEPAPAHPNGVRAIDHVVAASPDLDRSVAALQAAGLDLRRVREQPTPAGAPRQAFFRLGGEILEVIQEPQELIERAGGPDHPARFWGLALLVDDLDVAAERMAPHVGEVRAAVQPGRRIATVRRSAGLAVALALMSPDERAEEER
jgi:glyoxalase/bleomycin resistance protein/dioxygenase superfamily protein